MIENLGFSQHFHGVLIFIEIKNNKMVIMYHCCNQHFVVQMEIQLSLYSELEAELVS